MAGRSSDSLVGAAGGDDDNGGGKPSALRRPSAAATTSAVAALEDAGGSSLRADGDGIERSGPSPATTCSGDPDRGARAATGASLGTSKRHVRRPTTKRRKRGSGGGGGGGAEEGAGSAGSGVSVGTAFGGGGYPTTSSVAGECVLIFHVPAGIRAKRWAGARELQVMPGDGARCATDVSHASDLCLAAARLRRPPSVQS